MPAINNIQISQTTQRPASLSETGPISKFDEKPGGQGRSFEDTLSDQTEINAANETDTGLIANDIDADSADFFTIPSEDIDIKAEVSADSTDLVLKTEAPSTTLDEAAATIPMTDISTVANRDAALPSFVGTAEATTGQMPLALAADGAPLGTESSKIIPPAVASPRATGATGATGATQLTKAAKTDGAALPTATPSATDTTATADAPAAEDGDATDRPRLSDRAAETADYRAAAKPSAAPSDLAKIADAPANPTTLLASSDAPTPLKSVPVVTVMPTLAPLSGMSDRLAATILQTTNTQPIVTLDKLPQAVIAIALSAKSATLQIDPPELGRIQLDYQFDSQGRTVVTLTAESDAARAALMDRMASITAALEQGANGPIDVKLGDARDFGSEFGQASQDGKDTRSDQQDGANVSASNNTQTDDLQRFMRAPVGEAERLHILV